MSSSSRGPATQDGPNFTSDVAAVRARAAAQAARLMGSPIGAALARDAAASASASAPSLPLNASGALSSGSGGPPPFASPPLNLRFSSLALASAEARAAAAEEPLAGYGGLSARSMGSEPGRAHAEDCRQGAMSHYRQEMRQRAARGGARGGGGGRRTAGTPGSLTPAHQRR